MNMSLSKKLLRLVAPHHEKERQNFRIALSETMAKAEDITRTVKLMNGHMAEHIADWKKK